jgi:hypothetical protein
VSKLGESLFAVFWLTIFAAALGANCIMGSATAPALAIGAVWGLTTGYILGWHRVRLTSEEGKANG